MKNRLRQLSKDYSRIEKAIYFLEENFKRQPDLKEMARSAGMSEFHFQRIFQRWAGISPKKFLQFLTKECAKQLLEKSNVLEASFDAGLSGPSRLHDLLITCEAMSPGEYKQKGLGLTIEYGFHPTPFGECFMALTDRGICSLQFLDEADRKAVQENFQKTWKNAKLNQNQISTRKVIENIFHPPASTSKKNTVKLLYQGTNFQIKVWEALLRIAPGKVVTYKTIAEWIGSPLEVRAVGSAVGKNAIAYLIPCHRVIRSMGFLGGYRWGIGRKRAMLAKEASIKSAH